MKTRRIDPYRPFPVHVLPDAVASFIREGAAAIGCDESLVALPLLAAMGASIGTTRRIELKPGWAEYPIIWTVVIAESGSKKTPPFNIALAPLQAIQAEEFRQWKSATAHFEQEKLEHERATTSFRSGKEDGEPPVPPVPPTLGHVLTQDATIEALAGILADTPRGVMLARDELAGWFGSFNQYKSQAGADVPAWLELHQGGQLKVDRKKAPTIYVPRAGVWVTGTIQPATLRRCLTPEYFENGLAPRLLPAWPPGRVSRWSDRTIDPATQHAVDNLIRGLRTLTFCIDDAGEMCPIDIPLTPRALERFKTFVNEHGEAQAALEEERLRSVYSKLEASAARLALIHHLAHCASDMLGLHAEDRVGVESIEAGITLARWFGHEACRVYGMLAETEEEKDQRDLIELIQRKGGQISARTLQQTRWRCRANAQDAVDDLQRLVEDGYGRFEYLSTGGRQAHVFILDDPDNININESRRSDTANEASVDVDGVGAGHAEHPTDTNIAI